MYLSQDSLFSHFSTKISFDSSLFKKASSPKHPSYARIRQNRQNYITLVKLCCFECKLNQYHNHDNLLVVDIVVNVDQLELA